MEILVVLTALVCGAIGAPTLPEQGFQEFKPTQDVLEDMTQREKKSPAGNNEFTEFSNSEASPTHTFDLDSFPETARSLHFKKPLIVKKKVGYHLYRDSDEEKEQATSRESCKERVKVKLCDEKVLPKSSDPMRTTTIEDVGDHVMSEGEMKHSLKMAKEAIENLERDLTKIKQKPDTKINQRKHDDVDAQIHEDIDTARQVLEHIHKNFGDLESMSIRTTTAKDADSLHNVHLTIAKTEEERMAQWKEAMKNIQKNSEIARNIEDSFKSAGHDLSSNDFQTSQTSNIDENTDNHKAFNEMRTENTESVDNNLDETNKCDSKLHDAKLAQNQAEGTDQSTDDMNGFASNIMESTADVSSGKLLRNDNQETNFHEKPTIQTIVSPLKKNEQRLQQSRSSDNDSDGGIQFDTTDLKRGQISSMREVENSPEKDLNIDKFKTTATNGDALNNDQVSLTSIMKSTEADNMHNAADCMDKSIQKKPNHNQNTDKSEDMKTLIKSAINIDTSDGMKSNMNDKLENNLQTEPAKSADMAGTIVSNKLLHQTRNNENDAVTGETQHVEHAIVQPFDNTVTNHFQGKMGQNERVKSRPEVTNQGQETFSTHLKQTQPEVNTGIKTADNDMPTKPSSHAFNMRWSSDKGSDDFPSDFHNRVPSLNTHFMNGPHMTTSMNSASNFDASSTHSHVHASQVNRMHGHMSHGKSPDMDSIAQPNFNMNMRDATGNFGPENNVMRWKPTQESARTAYGPMTPGAASSGGSSAVGLFPNANMGGCSIPLLLSCSPSVTSGSLAKALPAGYASPAYRTEDEFTFIPNKREVKKTKDILGTTVVKMPTNTKQKTTLDTKQ